jgi:hypothetical protein
MTENTKHAQIATPPNDVSLKDLPTQRETGAKATQFQELVSSFHP